MPTYSNEKRRRIRQFADYLRLMELRAHKMAKGNCYVTFSESPPEGDGPTEARSRVAIALGRAANPGAESENGFMGEAPPADGWRQDSSDRFIQFAFNRDTFVMDIPRSTLFAYEARRIFNERLGFFFARNRRDLRWVPANWNDVLKFNPLQKVYLYRDEESAAEDMAFVMFDVWKFPADWRWYATAGAFGREDCGFKWEKALD